MFWNKNKKIIQRRVFLDYASTTPIAKEVTEEMQKVEKEVWANPSALYGEAILAKQKLNESRSKIANLLSCQSSEVIFTGGGTEGNNLALLGIFKACKIENFTPHIITTSIEHASVLEVCMEIEKWGGEVTYLSPNEDGIVSEKDVKSAIKENTVLVSVMYANNEIGTIQPIREIGRMIKELRIKNNSKLPYFHTDACQAVLYKDINVQKLGVDMITLDGIKIYGPRGAGVLYLKSNVKIEPVIFGGGQEKGLRSGTENVTSAIGLSKALEIASQMRETETARLTEIRDYAITEILKTFPKATLNGSRTERLPNNMNICFPGLDAEFAVISLDVSGISCSYSSSCRTLSEDSSSYVVEALGKPDCKTSSLRFTMGRETTKDDIESLLIALKKIMIQ